MINLSNVTYRVAGRLLFDETSSAIPLGHKVGIVGLNGSGKSTLLKLITGDIQPDSGSITISGIEDDANAIGNVSQEAPSGEMTPLEFTLAADLERTKLLAEAEVEQDPQCIADIQNRLVDIKAHVAPSRAAAILSGLGFDEAAQSRSMASFSGGWRMRVAIAAVLFLQPELLLLDEPTNHLDLEASIWLETHLKNYPKTLVIVSHDRGFLNRAVTGILHIEAQQLNYYKGTYDSFEKLRNEKLVAMEANSKKQAYRQKQMQAFIDRFRYTATKAKQAQSRIKALERMKVAGVVPPEPRTVFVFPDPEELHPPLITLEKVSVGYTENFPVLSNLNLRLDLGDRIGLLGQNGNGKSTLAKLLAGRLQKTYGEMNCHRKLKIGFFAQHQIEELDPERDAIEHLSQLTVEAAQEKLRSRLGHVGLVQEKQTTKVKYLSGGEKARLTLALIMYENPQVLILDEPTNHLDIDARAALVTGLNNFKGAAVLISHDRELLDAVVNEFWLIEDGTLQPFEGDLNDYKNWLGEKRIPLSSRERVGEENQTQQRGKKSLKKEERQAAAGFRKETTELRKDAGRTEAELSRLVSERQFLLKTLADQKTYELNANELEGLFLKKSNLDHKILELEERWLSLEEEIEQSR